MTGTIEAFSNTFSKGIARPNLFTVDFTKAPVSYRGGASGGPPGSVQMTSGGNDEFSLRVQSVTMPGKNITTTPNDNAYGPSYEMANGISFAEEIEVTFILDQDHRIRQFFNDWQDVIVNPGNYDLNYYDDYVGTMGIYQLDQNNEAASAIQVQDVFPKSVGPISYSMESGSSFQTVSVNMAFRRWVPIVCNFKGETVAYWLDSEKPRVTNPWPSLLDPLYKIQQTFGIGIPPGIEQGLNQVQAFSNYASDPTTFLKRTVASKVSGKLGGFLSGFGT